MTYYLTPDPALPYSVADVPYIAPSEQEKTQSLIQRLNAHFGYPNGYTRRLMINKTKTGGGLLQQLDDATYASVIAGKPFTADADTDRLTMAAFRMRGGQPFTVSSTGTLPTGLSAATTYYSGTMSGYTFKVYSNPDDARDGTNSINITDSGTGAHSLCVLSATELSTATSTAPAGLTSSSVLPEYEIQPFVRKEVIFLGDSITNCQMAGLAAHTPAQALHSQVLNATDSRGRASYYNMEYAYNRDIASLNLGTNSARYIYTTGAPASIEQNWKESYHWKAGHFRVAPTTQFFVNCLIGSNDCTYEGTGAQVWTRATEFLPRIRADYPDAKILLCTLIARGGVYTIRDYNQLVRANWQDYADAIVDLGAIPQFADDNTDVVTADRTYYGTDSVHQTPAATAIMGAAIKAVIDTF